MISKHHQFLFFTMESFQVQKDYRFYTTRQLRKNLAFNNIFQMPKATTSDESN